MLRHGSTAPVATTTIYNPATKTWVAGPNLSVARYNIRMAMLQDGRSTQRREARVTCADDAVLNAAPGRASGADARLDLERAIALLPPGARAALVLHDIEGYTHDEIAAMTGVATGTVKSQLHRARRLLQERLER